MKVPNFFLKICATMSKNDYLVFLFLSGNYRGLKLNLPIDETIKVDTLIGSDEKMTIKVKYKS